MEGGGVTLAVLLALAPFMIVADVVKLLDRAKMRRRNLSAHELALRRASHPFGIAAVLAGAVWLWPEFSAPLLPMIAHPFINPAPAVLLAAAVAFGLVLAASGFSEARGLRKWTLAARAFIKLGLGAFVIWKLWQFAPWAEYGREWWALALLRLALLGGVWCAVTALVRLLPLVIGGSSALRRARREAKRRNKPMQPAKF